MELQTDAGSLGMRLATAPNKLYQAGVYHFNYHAKWSNIPRQNQLRTAARIMVAMHYRTGAFAWLRDKVPA